MFLSKHFLCFSLLISFFASPVWAALPDIQTDLGYRDYVISALIEEKGSFDYRVGGGRPITFIVYRGRSKLTKETRFAQMAKALRWSHHVQFDTLTQYESSDYPTATYRVRHPKNAFRDFKFTITALEEMENSTASPALIEDLTAQAKLILEQDERDQSDSPHYRLEALETQIQALYDSNFHKDAELQKQLFKPILEQNILYREGARLLHPLVRINLITSKIPEKERMGVSKTDWVKILQKIGKMKPAVEQPILDQVEQLKTSEYKKDETNRQCLNWGGKIEIYFGAEDEIPVSLCRIGDAGIGLYTLTQYTEVIRKHQGPGVRAIARYLFPREQYVQPYDSITLSAKVNPSNPADLPTATVNLEKKTLESTLIGRKQERFEVAYGQVNIKDNLKASHYCKQVKGTPTQLYSLETGDVFKFCVFEKDGSAIEADTLFRGPKHSDNFGLTKVLHALPKNIF